MNLGMGIVLFGCIALRRGDDPNESLIRQIFGHLLFSVY